jgi:hypothetical protein
MKINLIWMTEWYLFSHHAKWDFISMRSQSRMCSSRRQFAQQKMEIQRSVNWYLKPLQCHTNYVLLRLTHSKYDFG